MYVVLSKLFWFFAAPSSLIAVLALTGVSLMAFTRRRRGFGLTVVATAILVLVWLFPVGEWAIKPLEDRFPHPQLPDHVDGFVLVDGFVAIRQSVAREQVQPLPAGQLFAATELALHYPGARIVLTAGEPGIVQTGQSEARLASNLLESLGVHHDRIVLETHARNKYENARASYALVRPSPDEVWVVIAAGYEMPRVVGAYRRAGWTNLIAYPVGFVSSNYSLKPTFNLPIQLHRFDLAVREWLALVVYRVLDRSSEVYPGA
jgi:uncharacterized SAM-binding protein YcdF (DUF218 family)